MELQRLITLLYQDWEHNMTSNTLPNVAKLPELHLMLHRNEVAKTIVIQLLGYGPYDNDQRAKVEIFLINHMGPITDYEQQFCELQTNWWKCFFQYHIVPLLLKDANEEKLLLKKQQSLVEMIAIRTQLEEMAHRQLTVLTHFF